MFIFRFFYSIIKMPFDLIRELIGEIFDIGREINKEADNVCNEIVNDTKTILK